MLLYAGIGVADAAAARHAKAKSIDDIVAIYHGRHSHTAAARSRKTLTSPNNRRSRVW